MFLTGRWKTIDSLLVLPMLLLIVVVVSPCTRPGDYRWLLYGRVCDRHFLSVKVILIQRVLAAHDELHGAWHLLVNARRNGDQRGRALLVLFVLWVAVI